MPDVAAIVPTIAGREDLFERTVASLKAASGETARIIAVKGSPTIGQGWQAGREALRDEGVVFFAADDVLMTPDSWQEALRLVGLGFSPSPRILNPDGTVHSTGTQGQGALLRDVPLEIRVGSSPFPWLRREWERALPRFPSIHYYADDWLAWTLRAFGVDTVFSPAYELHHLEGTAGRREMQVRAMQDRQAAIEAFCDHQATRTPSKVILA